MCGEVPAAITAPVPMGDFYFKGALRDGPVGGPPPATATPGAAAGAAATAMMAGN